MTLLHNKLLVCLHFNSISNPLFCSMVSPGIEIYHNYTKLFSIFINSSSQLSNPRNLHFIYFVLDLVSFNLLDTKLGSLSSELKLISCLLSCPTNEYDIVYKNIHKGTTSWISVGVLKRQIIWAQSGPLM